MVFRVNFFFKALKCTFSIQAVENGLCLSGVHLSLANRYWTNCDIKGLLFKHHWPFCCCYKLIFASLGYLSLLPRPTSKKILMECLYTTQNTNTSFLSLVACKDIIKVSQKRIYFKEVASR